jgi:hypothetical protein
VQSEKTNEINQKKDPNAVELSSLSWPTFSPRPARVLHQVRINLLLMMATCLGMISVYWR